MIGSSARTTARWTGDPYYAAGLGRASARYHKRGQTRLVKYKALPHIALCSNLGQVASVARAPCPPNGSLDLRGGGCEKVYRRADAVASVGVELGIENFGRDVHARIEGIPLLANSRCELVQLA